MEQIDTLLNGKKIIQDPDRFMFGIDAVILSDFAKKEIHKKDNLIDLGTGTGIIPLLLEGAVEGQNSISALEIQQDSALMAKRSVELNNLQDKITIVQGDIKAVTDGGLFSKHSFSCVTCNPPYMINQHGRQNELTAKTIARHEVLCNLEDVIAAAEYLLKPHGKFFIIHRPFRLPEIFSLMHKYNLEPKRMQLCQPYENTEPNIVMIEARKNANPRLKIEAPLIVYEEPGKYSKAVQEIYANSAR